MHIIITRIAVQTRIVPESEVRCRRMHRKRKLYKKFEAVLNMARLISTFYDYLSYMQMVIKEIEYTNNGM